jgi:hypothetical protein
MENNKLNQTPAKRGVSCRTENLFSSKLLNRSFSLGLLLSVLCFVSAVGYLFYFLITTNSALDKFLKTPPQTPLTGDYLGDVLFAKMFMARISLFACGAFIGLAFGFLGFSLFLLGFKGEMNVEATMEKASVKVARMTPGVFVMLCSAILIGICVTKKPEMSINRGYEKPVGKSKNLNQSDEVPLPSPPSNWEKP